ncbi:PAS domain-containing protein [Methanoculleus sp.]|uniref:PAS domain-containing protein n=1 Tax=Methanoculleus sp. TaxID=90427 RepID=UPI00260D7279|nr:PAS domain-containing protein [Methanoculleus sp.]MDD2787118.1 PAS domain-containing protein [Methanoculleus sp.]
MKYLEIMQSQGSVGMRQVGTAKMYFTADRIPVSAVRRFCRHYIILDHLLYVIEVSASMPANLGMPAGERGTGRRIDDLLPGLRGISDLETRLRSALRGEEQTVRCQTGKHKGERAFSVSFIPTVLESGRPAVSLVLKDVTESDQGGNGDELGILRYQALFEDQSEYIVRLSPEGYVRRANPGYCRMAGQAKEDLVGRRFQPPVTADEREQWNRQLRSLTVEHPATTIRCRISARNGGILWQSWTLRALYGSSGTLLEYQLVGHDVNEYPAARGGALQYGEETGRRAPPREREFWYYEDTAHPDKVESASWFARYAVEMATDGICWFDPSGRILHTNQALCGDLGYTRDDLRLLYLQEIDIRCDRESLEQIWATLRREGCYYTGSMLRRLDGTLLPAEITAKYLKLDGREYCCAVFRLISGAGDKIRWRSEDLFGMAFDESPVGLALYDHEGSLIHANKAFRELSVPLTTSGARLFQYPSLTREEIGMLQQGRQVRLSCSVAHGEGNPGATPIETNISPLCDPKNTRPLGYMVRVQDTDGYEKAGTLVRSASSLLEETIRNLPEAAFAIDRDGRVMAWNRAIETMTGISAADMLGKGNYEYSVPFYRGRVPMLVDQAIGSGDLPVGGYACCIREEGNCLIAEKTASLPNGYSRVIREKAFPVYASKGKIAGAIGFVYDITALCHTEELLKRGWIFNAAAPDAIDAQVVVADDDGRIVWCNRRCRALTGHDPTGRRVHEFFGMDPLSAGEPFTRPGLAKDGEQPPIRWSRRTFVQPGAGRFEIYTGVYPATGETLENPV